MSATPTNPPPQPAPVVAGPNQIALLWERYRSLAYVILIAVFAALGINFWLQQRKLAERNEVWSGFVTSIGLEADYASKDAMQSAAMGLSSESTADLPKLEAALAKADSTQKPYVLLAIARRALADKKWDRASSALDELEKGFPQHMLVKPSEYPLQLRSQVKRDTDEPLAPGKTPELKPIAKGSVVAQLRAQIEAAKGYTEPSQFARPEIPADAPKVKFETAQGSFTIALMPQAPKHRDAFLELAKQTPPYWEGTAIDEIRRPGTSNAQKDRPRELHFGLDSSRVDQRDQWKATDDAKKLLDHEASGLSHFAGAVAARPEAANKSAVDRLWITVDDKALDDDTRVVFGYVVEGLDVLERICALPLGSTSEEETGSGRPLDTVRITKVTVLQ